MSQLISVTTNAVDQIKKILLEAPIGTDALVVGVDKSGCSGYSYSGVVHLGKCVTGLMLVDQQRRRLRILILRSVDL